MDPTDYEYEYDDEPRQGGRILWGRIAVLGIALALMFLLGRCTAGGDTAEGEVADLEGQVEALEDENADLRAQIEALRAGGTNQDEDDADDADDESDADDDTSGAEDDAGDAGDEDGEDTDVAGDEAEEDEESEAGLTHEVRQGEHLYAIADRYYGDGAKFVLIVEANGLAAGDPIQPGQVLDIPPDQD
jgi:nucleoid-associated protein YgaU